MGNIERHRIRDTINFAANLANLNISSGCLQASILAMGGTNIHLQDVVDANENGTGILNLSRYLANQGLMLGNSLELDRPLSLNQVKRLLESTKVVNTELNSKDTPSRRIAGILLAFGRYLDEPPHVIGILPRGDMTKNLRKILKSIGVSAHIITRAERIKN